MLGAILQRFEVLAFHVELKMNVFLIHNPLQFSRCVEMACNWGVPRSSRGYKLTCWRCSYPVIRKHAVLQHSIMDLKSLRPCTNSGAVREHHLENPKDSKSAQSHAGITVGHLSSASGDHVGTGIKWTRQDR